MKRKREPKLLLYQKYLKENNKQKIEETISKKANLAKEQIIVKETTTIGSVIEVVISLFIRLIRIVFYLVIMLLLSLALTVLVNEELRTLVFDKLGIFI